MTLTLKEQSEASLKDERFRKVISKFRARPEQLHMTGLVADAIERRRDLIVEAGTGVGKTLAYLVPVILSGKHAVVSTGTRYLQEQIYKKDLPSVMKALGRSAEVTMLKGRANYLCLERLERMRGQDDLFDEQRIFFNRVEDWATRTDSGEIGELADENDPKWVDFTSTPETCLGSQCDHYEDCFVVKARARAIHSDIVVVNHHLLLADMTLKEEGFGQLLPSADTVIVDEAHQLSDTTDQFFAISFGSKQMHRLIRDLREHDEIGNVPEIKVLIDQMDDKTTALRRVLGSQQSAQGAYEEIDNSEFRRAGGELSEVIKQLTTQLDPLREHDDQTGHLHRRLESMQENFAATLNKDNEDRYIFWFRQYKGHKGQKGGFSLHATPLQAATLFAEKSKPYNANWIYTSATLSVVGDFSYFKKCLGLNCDDATLGTPYDYQKQAALYIPSGIPDPGSRKQTSAFVRACLDLLEHIHGGAFLLFTSYRAMHEARQIITGDEDNERLILVQGSCPKHELIRTFCDHKNCILLGTSSFWEGVDVRGGQLRLVAIDRLPFAAPDDPLIRARSDWFKKNGANYFTDVSVPQAVIQLRQGAGRLIRDESDRGVIFIGDTRVLHRPYGRAFINSLPSMKICRRIEQLTDYIA